MSSLLRPVPALSPARQRALEAVEKLCQSQKGLQKGLHRPERIEQLATSLAGGMLWHLRLEQPGYMILFMITDSIPWKVELLKIADRLEGRKFQRRWTERTGFLVERDVMVSAYAVRKLLEARKISDSLATQQMDVRQHLLIGDMPDVYNRYFVWENYDLDSGRNQVISIREFCNQIIHSWNWMISATEDDKFDGIYVSSDRGRRKFIYFIDIDVLIRLLRAIGSEDVRSIEMRRDETGEMHITRVTAAGEGDI